MGCCCSRDNGPGSTCCPTTMCCCSCNCRCCCDDETNKACMRLPYKDPLMITAQVLAIIAFVLSWGYQYYVSLLVVLIPFVLQQVVWCSRYNKFLLIIDGVACIIVGGFFIYVGWAVWDDNRVGPDFAAFGSAVLWAASGLFTLAFVTSGRHAKWEAKLEAEWTKKSVDAEVDADAEVVAVEELEELEEGTATPTPVIIK